MKFQKNGQTIFLENGEEGLLSQSVMSYAWQSVTIKVIWVKHDYESKEVDGRMFVAESAELMKEWNTMRNSALGLDPARLKIRSNKKVWWRCSKCGYVYQAPPNRRSQGSGCRKCADKAIWSIRRANKERANAKNGYIQMELFDETKKAT